MDNLYLSKKFEFFIIAVLTTVLSVANQKWRENGEKDKLRKALTQLPRVIPDQWGH